MSLKRIKKTSTYRININTLPNQRAHFNFVLAWRREELGVTARSGSVRPSPNKFLATAAELGRDKLVVDDLKARKENIGEK